MIIGNFMFDLPKLGEAFLLFWVIFAILILFFIDLNKEMNYHNTMRLLVRSLLCALALWLSLIAMVCLHLHLNHLKENQNGISSTLYSAATPVFV